MADVPALQKHGGRVVKASSEEPGHEADRAIDGDPTTFWHTAYSDRAPAFPHGIEIGFAHPVRLAGLTLLPRQDGNPNGWVKDFSVQVSNDGVRWSEPVAQGALAKDAETKTIRFTEPAVARFLKFVALSGHTRGSWASVAEIGILPAE